MSKPAPARTPGTPRPLYVEPYADVRLTLEDGAAGIRRDDQLETTIPLRHLSRIIVPEQAELSFELLRACARRGIPVVVQTEEGQPLFRVIPHPAVDPGLYQRFADFTTRIDWPERLENWLANQQSRITHRLRETSQLHHTIPLREIPRILRTKVEHHIGPENERKSHHLFTTVALAEVHRMLAQAGLHAGSETGIVDLVDLPERLAELVALSLESFRLQCASSWPREYPERCPDRVPPIPYAFMVRKLESERNRFERPTLALIDRLHRFLIDTA